MYHFISDVFAKIFSSQTKFLSSNLECVRELYFGQPILYPYPGGARRKYLKQKKELQAAQRSDILWTEGKEYMSPERHHRFRESVLKSFNISYGLKSAQKTALIIERLLVGGHNEMRNIINKDKIATILKFYGF
jgi:hypothetical protein